MGWIFDIAVVVLVIIAAVIGAKKGFFRACFDFCGALIAMIAAGLLSSPVAEWIFTTFFRPSLVEKISAAVMGLGASEAVNTVFDAFPELIQRALEAAGITQGSIMAQVQDKTDSIAEAITDALSAMSSTVVIAPIHPPSGASSSCALMMSASLKCGAKTSSSTARRASHLMSVAK